MSMFDDDDFEVFDEETSRKIEKEHAKDMEDAVRSIGMRKMGLTTTQCEIKETSGSQKLRDRLASMLPWKTQSVEASTALPPPVPDVVPLSAIHATPSLQPTAVLEESAMDSLHRVPPDLPVRAFEVREDSLGPPVIGQVVVLDGSCYVWAGVEGAAGGDTQGALAVAIGMRFTDGPASTALLPGGEGEAVSLGMSQRLSKRTGKMVFCSCNLPKDCRELVAIVERRVIDILAKESSEQKT